MYVGVGCMSWCMYGGLRMYVCSVMCQRRTLCVLLHRSSPSLLETGHLTEPGACHFGSRLAGQQAFMIFLYLPLMSLILQLFTAF